MAEAKKARRERRERSVESRGLGCSEEKKRLLALPLCLSVAVCKPACIAENSAWKRNFLLLEEMKISSLYRLWLVKKPEGQSISGLLLLQI